MLSPLFVEWVRARREAAEIDIPQLILVDLHPVQLMPLHDIELQGNRLL
jgi:hypothetical protein